MMFILWLLLEIFLSCLDAFYFYAIPTFQLGTKDWVQKKHCVLYGLCYVLLITMYNYLTINSISVIYITITAIIVYVCVFTKGNWIYKIFWALFPVALLYGIEMLTFSLLLHIHQHITIDMFALQNVYRLQMVLISKLILLGILIFLLKKKINIKEIGHRILVPSVIMIAVVLFIMSFLQLTEFMGKDMSQKVLLNISIAFLILNLAYLGAFVVLNKKNKGLFQEQQMKMEVMAQHYAELLVSQEKFQQYQQHINENLQVLWDLAKTHKVPQLERYLAQISRINQEFKQWYFTGDQVIDRVLASKQALAQQKQIQWQTELSWPPEHPFEPLDIGRILTILLDNALEALDQWEDKERAKVIKLSLKTEENCLLICLENPTPEEKGTPEEMAGLLAGQSPGLGLKIVHDFVHKYQGSWEITHQDHCFQVLLTLPLKVGP